MVRLEGIKDLADKFVLVRLPRIDNADLSLFQFDYDVTFMVFFLNADERIYGRYGGRDARDPDNRMSLPGLHHAMEAVLDLHAREGKAPEAAPPKRTPQFIRDVPTARRSGGCFHCHEVKETLNAQLQKTGKWSLDMVWRYPPPDNLGLVLEVDRGNVVKKVAPDSPAARAGLQAGDVVQRLNGIPVFSFADAQFALDRAPATGAIPVTWKRDGKDLQGELALFANWRKTDISWRPSSQKFVPTLRLSGTDLSEKDKTALGLPVKQLAFRVDDRIHTEAEQAGVRLGDIVVGINNQKLEMDCAGLFYYVRRNYLTGERITIDILRAGKRLSLTMTLTAL